MGFFLSGIDTIAPNLISPKLRTPSCWACINTCSSERFVSSFFAASSALISNSLPFFPLNKTVIVLRLAILCLASNLPSSVNCHVFWRRSSPLTLLECSETKPLDMSSLIARETFGGCIAHTSEIPVLVTSLVTI